MIQVPEASYFRTYQIMETDSNLHAISVRNNQFIVPSQVLKFVKGADEIQGWIWKSITQKTATMQNSMDLLPFLMKPSRRIDVAGNSLKELQPANKTSSKPSKSAF